MCSRWDCDQRNWVKNVNWFYSPCFCWIWSRFLEQVFAAVCWPLNSAGEFCQFRFLQQSTASHPRLDHVRICAVKGSEPAPLQVLLSDSPAHSRSLKQNNYSRQLQCKTEEFMHVQLWEEKFQQHLNINNEKRLFANMLQMA